MDLAPADALVRDAAGERRVGVDAVAIGALIVIRPGEKIPLDGEVVAGQSAVNQAPVTGESLPVEKSTGDEVFAGTINGRGALDVRVTRLRRDTTLARIIHLVERAQAQRAPAQTLVERFARVYTPAVLVAGGRASPWCRRWRWHQAWHDWFYRALVLLVVSCPCALVISTPVSVVAALAGAARKGVLIKGGAHLERASQVRCVAFDKTGTLTCGTPEVVEVIALNGAGARVASSRSPRRWSSARRIRSRRPFSTTPLRQGSLPVPADAVVGAARQRGGRPGGRRARAARQPSPVRGARALLAGVSRSPRRPGSEGPDRRAGRARRPDGRDHCGRRSPAPERQRRDRPAPRRRESSAIVMLTGDSHGTARAIAAELGVDECPRRAAAGRQGGGGGAAAARVRPGGDGGRRRQRRAGAGLGGRRDRDGRGRQRRGAGDRRRRADGRRAAANPVRCSD